MKEVTRKMMAERASRDLSVHLGIKTFASIADASEIGSMELFGMNVVVSSGVPADAFMLVDRDGCSTVVRVTALDELAEAVCGGG